MTFANLMPRHRLIATRRRARLRAWTAGLTAYGAVLVVGYVVAGRFASAAAGDVPRMVEDARSQARTGELASKKLRAEVSTLSTRLNAARAISQHPDWSVLLGVIAGLRGEDLVLSTIDLSPAAPPPKASPGRPAMYSLLLAGVSRNHASVTAFVLRLESTGLFESVMLTDTRAAESDGEARVSFQLRCTLNDQNKGGA